MACRGCSFRSTTRAGVSGSERRSRSPRRPVAAALPAGDILRMDCELLEVFGGCTAWGDWCVRAMLWAHLCSLPHLRHKHGPLQLDAAGHVYPAPPGRSHGRIVLPAAAAGSGGVSLHSGLREASPGQGVNRCWRMSNRVARMFKALEFGPACSDKRNAHWLDSPLQAALAPGSQMLHPLAKTRSPSITSLKGSKHAKSDSRG